MPKVHRIGDLDSSGDSATAGSDDVFANGGPTLGGAIIAVSYTHLTLPTN